MVTNPKYTKPIATKEFLLNGNVMNQKEFCKKYSGVYTVSFFLSPIQDLSMNHS